MSRLDRHIAMVQNKLALGRFVHALAWASVVLGLVVWGAIFLDRLTRIRPPHAVIFFWGGVGLCGLYATWLRSGSAGASLSPGPARVTSATSLRTRPSW